jgi:prolyl oligopeptidase
VARRPLVRALAVPVLGVAAFAAGAEWPSARKALATDTYHGVTVTEDYRWLEDPSSPEVRAWVEAENRATRAHLDALPARTALRERLKALYAASSSSYYDVEHRAGTFFALKNQPPLEHPLLVTLKSPDDPTGERVVVDPNARREQVAMSEGGSEDASLYFFETGTGKSIGEVVPRASYPTGAGSAAWTPDGAAVYYTRYPQGDERAPEDRHFYQQIYRHRLGTPASADQYVLGREFPRIAEARLETRGDGRTLLVSVANGDGGEFAHWVRTGEGPFLQVTRFEDRVVGAALGADSYLYFLSRKGAPRGKVLRLPLATPTLGAAETIVKEGDVAIEALVVTARRLYAMAVAGGPSQVDVYEPGGRPLGRLPIPEVSSVSEIVPVGEEEALFRATTFLEPPAWYRYDRGGKASRTALVTTAPVRFDDAEVSRELATSKDGTKVPVNVIRRKGTPKDGQNPALLTGYGGYSISLSPQFLGIAGRLWLDQGGVFAIANLRGGGEFGEAWHAAGNLTLKQNVFDDFIASAEHLISRRYTSAEHLAIEGGSNGGLLMGAVLTQRPELFRAVVSHVGIFDMLRVELDPNGAFNVTEFGSVKDEAQFRALLAYSPYHRVRDGAAYPAVFMLTGDNDGRVNPAHSRKMTARLQAASRSARPILLRTTASAGHGIGTALSERIEQTADVFAFLFEQLGLAPPDRLSLPERPRQ